MSHESFPSPKSIDYIEDYYVRKQNQGMSKRSANSKITSISHLSQFTKQHIKDHMEYKLKTREISFTRTYRSGKVSHQTRYYSIETSRFTKKFEDSAPGETETEETSEST